MQFGNCGKNLIWAFDGGTLTIEGNGDMDDCPNFSEVTARPIKQIVVEDGATSVADFAFGFCSGLRSIELPDTVTTIGNSAFLFCENLQAIKIPAQVKEIAKSTFCGCWSLTEIDLPAALVEIGDDAFINCVGLQTLKIPANVKKIGNNAFKGCESLTEIKIPASVIEIGNGIFAGCESLSKIFCAANCNFAENLRGGNCAEIIVSNDTSEKFSWQIDGETLTIIDTDKLKSLTHDENFPWYDRRESIKRIIIES